MPVADGVVVRIEEDSIQRLERQIAGLMQPEHEGLEKPGRMCQMPLYGTCIRHGLDRAILGRKRPGKGARHLPDRQVSLVVASTTLATACGNLRIRSQVHMHLGAAASRGKTG